MRIDTTAYAIRRLRERINLTQKDFAEALGVAVATVSRYENGQEPAPVVLRRLIGVCESVRDGIGLHVFNAKWRAAVESSTAALPSRGSARRVPVSALAAWADALKRGEHNKVLEEIELFIRS